ncbi:AMP-binding enzyme family protein (macronuclear) [Tetrahymena thermophila SB210]|uniref:AMP-binding enzyme family protein n=1 Tax=Tetrahymena thermophila (strain SB210) TaxID=312017 RepID=Q22YP2_TETTS|nr:AMP-binding enzyme family protein [Tetrahymena thermophila SB210]EAR90629.2 AMP-binding enzyme family protein [Tetrahymena thermophila SB210]|eukprot:XP_001010874.2 AMP-binding enzyme family protein [Tetrahymena thermophila SB210]
MLQLKKIDIFSSEFSFYVENELTRKRTLFGVCLTYITIITGITYLIYLSIQYKNNQIDPKFRSQTFVSEDQIDVNLSEDLVGFRFEYLVNKNIEQLQQQQNKTYIVYMPVLFYYNQEDFYYYPLKILNCTNPDLEGYNCLDFSQLQNFTLTVSTKMNFNTQIFILVYRCLDIDSVKTTIPNNCASQKEIDDAINSQYSNLRLKLLTSQYNITSQKFQTNYRNQFIYTSANLFIQTKLKAQKQTTKINEGFLIQSESTYAAPINYDTFTQQFDKAYANLTSGVGPYLQVDLAVDELQILINIEFPIYPEVLSLVNSIVALMMGVGYIARYFSQRLIKQQFFLLFLQNLFQETYEQLLKFNNMLPNNQEVCFKKAEQNQDVVGAEFEDNTNALSEDRKSNENKNLFSPKEQQKKQMRLSSTKKRYLERTCIKDHSNLQNLKQKNVSLTQNLLLSPIRRQLSLIISKRQFCKVQQKSIKNGGIVQQQGRLCHSQKNEIQEISDAFSKKLKFIFSEQNFQKIKSKIFGRKQQFKKVKNANSVEQSIQEEVEQQINKSLDIFQLYKDIIFLKKAVIILLTKDQLATLQLVGYSPKSQFLQHNQESQSHNQKQNPKKKSYFQQQIEIYESQELQSQYIKKFFSKFSEGNHIVSETDYRILTSIMKQDN